MKRPRQYIAAGGSVKVYFRFFGCSRSFLHASISRVLAAADSVGSNVECGLIDLLIEIEPGQLDRPIGEEGPIHRVNGYLDAINVRQIQSALSLVKRKLFNHFVAAFTFLHV